MKIGLLADPGAGDALAAVAAGFGSLAVAIAGDGPRLPRCDAVIVAGGAAGEPVLRGLRAFAAAGKPVLGMGEGFRILCASGLLPGGLDAPVAVATAGELHLRVEGRPTPFTSAIPAGRVMRLGRATAAGRYAVADAAELERRGQIVFRHCDEAGGARDAEIAGVCNERGNVVAVVTEIAGDGAQLIQSLLLHWRATKT